MTSQNYIFFIFIFILFQSSLRLDTKIKQCDMKNELLKAKEPTIGVLKC
jgi:hypothetical protein